MVCVVGLNREACTFLQEAFFTHDLQYMYSYIMEYGSTPYVGMARKKMAAPYNAYKIIRSELGFDYSHRLL